MFTLTGTIIDHAGLPRVGVEVALIPSPAVTLGETAVAVGHGRSVTTDERGSFSTTLVHSPGLTYILHAKALGLSQQFEVPEQDGTTIDLKDVVEVLVASPLSPAVRGPVGPVGPSPYEMAVSSGLFEGTEEEWLASLAATPTTVHGALTGLEADDHPQYLTVDRGDERYQPVGDYIVRSDAPGGATLQDHILSPTPHPQYDDLQSLALLFQNRLV